MRWPVLAVAVCVAGCGGSAGAAKPASLPVVTPGDPCPVTTGQVTAGAFGAALGDGPVAPVGLAPGGVLELAPARNFESREWAGQKVLWARKGDVRGTVTIRGRRLDGPGEVRFDHGDVPPDRIVWRDPDAGDWTDRPSFTRLRGPGCYAYTITGAGLDYHLVFRAVL